MRILLLTHAFNSLTQRLYAELAASGHELSVELDIHDSVTAEAAALFRPHLVVAPYLRRAIPEAVWREHVCLVVHPGPVGDRGPSALDWAVLRREKEWGVTVLQAEAEMDAGPVWASESFPVRAAKKSSLYRGEVSEAAVRAVLHAVSQLPAYRAGTWTPRAVPARPMHARVTQGARAIDWAADSTEIVMAKLDSGDGSPGVADALFGSPCHLYDARPFPARGAPGAVLARAGDGIVRATVDGAVWIGHVKRPHGIKLPVAVAFPEVSALPGDPEDRAVRYEEADGVATLTFDLYNGAMGTAACERVRAAFEEARRRPTRVIVLRGGEDFFSNGLDLNLIEAAESPSDESWRNIQAMDDLCEAILTTESHLTVSALRGNAGAGGAFLALAADRVWARSGAILNPHYKNMGNLHGSEYWSYLLPKRVGASEAAAIMRSRLPLSAARAASLGFVDEVFGEDPPRFDAQVRARAAALAASPDWAAQLEAKRQRRREDEAAKPLSRYRAEELAHMKRNFYGFDPSYHVARHHFVRKTPHSFTPRHLAVHRELGWRVPGE